MANPDRLERELRRYREGMRSRNNDPRNYLHLMIPYFRCIDENRLNEVSAPICVQMQVSSTCSTHCKMCDHWKDKSSEMALAEWKKVFEDVSAFGVSTVIFSGGEPLMRSDIADLLESAYNCRLKIGLLTNGTMVERPPEDRQRVIEAVGRCVEWVAISIDGTETEDTRIRNPVVANRMAALEKFCSGIKSKYTGVKFSATVTLQTDNIQMDFHQACRFIHEKLDIPQVNFKLATGAKQALRYTPGYLMEERELAELIEFLWEDSLPEESNEREGNNLSYLRRCFVSGIFDVKDAAAGVPLRSFYERESLRCYIPFIFSLVDSDGGVYPCCHLYRDNHGSDPLSKRYRTTHMMGNVKESRFDLIWNAETYVEERKRLKTVNPTGDVDFFPCGECTRYCQHNLALTRIHKAYEGNLEQLEQEIEDLKREQTPVWF